MFYTILMNPSLEYHMNVSSTGQNGVFQGDYTEFTVTGYGVDMATAFSDIGELNITLGFSGGYTGERILRILEQRGLHTEFVNTSAESPLSFFSHGENEDVFYSPILTINDSDFRSLLGQLSTLTSRDMALLSLDKVPSHEQANLQIIRIVHSIGSNFACCSEDENIPSELLALHPDLLVMKVSEGISLVELTMKMIRSGAHRILAMNEEQAILIDAGKSFVVNANLKNVNIEKALAAFVGSLERDEGERLKYALACSLCTEEITKDQISSFLKSHIEPAEFVEY